MNARRWIRIIITFLASILIACQEPEQAIQWIEPDTGCEWSMLGYSFCFGGEVLMCLPDDAKGTTKWTAVDVCE